jgi:hypothetical protein
MTRAGTTASALVALAAIAGTYNGDPDEPRSHDHAGALAGQVYYIQQHVDLDSLHARTRLELLDDMTGRQALAQCRKHGNITDNGRAKAKDIVRARQKTLQDDLP